MSSKRSTTPVGAGSRLAVRGALVAGATVAFVGAGAAAAMAAGPDEATTDDAAVGSPAAGSDAAPVADTAQAAPVEAVPVAAAEVSVSAAAAPEGSLARWYQDGVGATDEQPQPAEPVGDTVVADTPALTDDQGVEPTSDSTPVQANETPAADQTPLIDEAPATDETPAVDVTEALATAPFMGTWYAPDGSSRLTVHEQSLGWVPSSILPDHEGLVEDLPGAWWHAVDGTTATVDWHTMIGNYQQTMTLLANGTLQLSGGGRPTVVYSRSAVSAPKTEAPTSEPPTAEDPTTEAPTVEAPAVQAPVDYPVSSVQRSPVQIVDYAAPEDVPSSGQDAPAPELVYATPLIAVPSGEETADPAVESPAAESEPVSLVDEWMSEQGVDSTSLVRAWMAAQGLDSEDAVLSAWGEATGGPTVFLMRGPLSVSDGMPMDYHLAKDQAMQWAAGQATDWAATQALAWAATRTQEPSAPVGTVLVDDVVVPDDTTAIGTQSEAPAPPQGVLSVDASLVLTDGAGMAPLGAVTAGDGSQAVLVLYADAAGVLQVGALSQAQVAGEVPMVPSPVQAEAGDTSLVPVGVVTLADGSQAAVVLYVGADGVVRVGQVALPAGTGAPVADPAPVAQPTPAPAPTPVVPLVVTPPPAAVDFVGTWLPEVAPTTVLGTTSLVISADGTLAATTGRGTSVSSWTQSSATTGTWGGASTYKEPAVETAPRTITIPATSLTLLSDGRLQVVTYSMYDTTKGTTTYYTKVPAPQAPVAQPTVDTQSAAPANVDFVGQYVTDAPVAFTYQNQFQKDPATGKWTTAKVPVAGSGKVGSGDALQVVVRDDGSITVGSTVYGWVRTGANTIAITQTSAPISSQTAVGPESGQQQAVQQQVAGTVVVSGLRTETVGTITMLSDGRLAIDGLFNAQVTASGSSAPVDGAPLRQADSALVGYWYTDSGLQVTVRPDGTVSVLGHRTDGGSYDRVDVSLKNQMINPDGDQLAMDSHFPGGPNGGWVGPDATLGTLGLAVVKEGRWEAVDATTIKATFDVSKTSFVIPGANVSYNASDSWSQTQYGTLTYTFTLLPDGSVSVTTTNTLDGTSTTGNAVQTYAPSFAGSWEARMQSSPYVTSQAHVSLGADGTFTADFGQLGLSGSSTVWVGTWVQTDQSTATLTYTAWDVADGYGRLLEQGTSQMQVVANGGLRLSTGGYAWDGVTEFYRTDGTAPKAGEALQATAVIPDVLASAVPSSVSSMVGLWWSQYPTSLSGAEAGAAMFPVLALGPDGTAVFAQGPEWIPGEGLGQDMRCYSGTWEQVDLSNAVVTLDDGTQIAVRIGADGVLRMDLPDNPHWPDIAGGGWAFDRMDPAAAQLSVYDAGRAADYKVDTKRHAGDVIGDVVAVAAVVVSVVLTVVSYGALAGLVVAAGELMSTGNTFVGPDAPGSGAGSTATGTTTVGSDEAPFGLSPTTGSPSFQFNPPGQA